MIIILLLIKALFAIFCKFLHNNQINIADGYQIENNSENIENAAFQTQEYYEKPDENGWIGLFMECPVEECVKQRENNINIIINNEKKYWEHTGGTESDVRNELPKIYPTQFNKYGKLRCHGCHASSQESFNYDEWYWNGCSTHEGAKKGMPGYLTNFINQGKFFDS